MQLRLYAMYERSRVLLILLVTSFLVCIGSTIGIISEMMSQEIGELRYCLRGSKKFHSDYATGPVGIKVSSHPIPLIPEVQFCFLTSLPAYYTYFWVPTLAFEALIFILCLPKGIDYVREYGSSALPRMNAILIRDSILYFIV